MVANTTILLHFSNKENHIPMLNYINIMIAWAITSHTTKSVDSRVPLSLDLALLPLMRLFDSLAWSMYILLSCLKAFGTLWTTVGDAWYPCIVFFCPEQPSQQLNVITTIFQVFTPRKPQHGFCLVASRSILSKLNQGKCNSFRMGNRLNPSSIAT